MAIMHALTKFRQYLMGSKFVVKTDHNSLKYFLEQKDLRRLVIEGKRSLSGEIVQCIPGGRHQLADFGVERHTLVTRKIIRVLSFSYLFVFRLRSFVY